LRCRYSRGQGDASSCRRSQPATLGLDTKQECIPVSFSSKSRTSPSASLRITKSIRPPVWTIFQLRASEIGDTSTAPVFAGESTSHKESAVTAETRAAIGRLRLAATNSPNLASLENQAFRARCECASRQEYDAAVGSLPRFAVRDVPLRARVWVRG